MSWFGEDKLKPLQHDPATEEFGAASRMKQWLVRRWLREMPVMPKTTSPPTSPPESIPYSHRSGSSEGKEMPAVEELIGVATPVALAELDPTAASKMQQRMPIEKFRSLSPARSEGGTSEGRPASSGGNSGVMVEEKGASEDERSGDEGREREKERKRKQRLNVPV